MKSSKKNTPKVKVLPLKSGSLWIHHFWESTISTIHWAPWPARKTRPSGSEKCHGNLTPRDATLVIRLWLSMQTRQGIRWLRICFGRKSISQGLSLVISRTCVKKTNLSIPSQLCKPAARSWKCFLQKASPSASFWWYNEYSAPAPLGKLWKITWFLSLLMTKLACFWSHHIAPIRLTTLYFNQEWIHLLSLTYKKHMEMSLVTFQAMAVWPVTPWDLALVLTPMHGKNPVARSSQPILHLRSWKG